MRPQFFVFSATIAAAGLLVATSCKPRAVGSDEASSEAAPESSPAAAGRAVPEGFVELLRDPELTKGVTGGYANLLSPSEREEANRRWAGKGITGAEWAFWEISGNSYFANNPQNPEVQENGVYRWSTEDGSKQFLRDGGLVRMLYDTSKEWREGGNITWPDETGAKAPYAHRDPATTWPHFLIGQHLTGDNDPSTPLREGDKIFPGRFEDLRFRIDVKLNQVLRLSAKDFTAEHVTPGHALFYLGFGIMPRNTANIKELGKVYLLVPAIYSHGDNRHFDDHLPWTGPDQFGDGVYFSGSFQSLRPAEWVHYDVDVKALVAEGLAAFDRKVRERQTPLDREYSPDDYFVAFILIGWEIWGDFTTDVEFKNLSMIGKHE
jgi:hypothetical protein